MDTVRVVLIGAGNISRNSHLPAYRAVSGVTVVGVSDVNKELAEKMAQDFGIPHAFSDHREMLEALRPDAVSVCVPNRFHCPVTLDALKAGAHVLCEKPPALTPQEAESMAETAAREKRLLSYGFHLRFSDGVSELKGMIDRGELGEIYHADAKWLRRRGVPGWGIYTNKAAQGGGPLIDIGAHALDLALYLLGYPEVDYVCADMYDKIGTTGRHGFLGDWDPEKYTVEDAVFSQVRFRNGMTLRLDASFALNMRDQDVRQVSVYGDRLGASLFPLEIYGGGDGEPWNRVSPFPSNANLYEREIRDFIAAVRGEAPLTVTAEQGLRVQQLIHLMYTSAEKRAPVFAG